MPPQQTDLSVKLYDDVDDWGVSAWKKQSMDALEAIGRLQYTLNYDLKENYDLIRGRFIYQHYLDKNDYFDMTSAMSQQFNLPNYIKHYDITSKAVNVLVGEYIKRPDGFRVRANDKFSFNEFIERKTELLQGYIGSQIQKTVSRKLELSGLDPNRDVFQNEQEQSEYQQLIAEKSQEFTPPQLEKYMREDFYTAAEGFGQHVIELDRDRFNTKEKEAEEFEDMLVADRCFRHFYLTATGYNQETWNPLQTFFHRSPEVKNIEDGDYVGRVFWLSKAQIVDRYGWLMTQEQIEALYPSRASKKGVKDGAIMNEAFNASMFPFASYRDYMMQVNALGFDPHTGFPYSMNNMNPITDADMDMLFGTGYNLNFRTEDIVQVTDAYWRSQRKIGKLTFINPETGEPDTQIVDETFDPKLFGIKVTKETYNDSDEVNTIAWTWVTQIWKGIKINVNYSDSNTGNEGENKFTQRAMYLDIKPAPFQFKGNYNPFQPKLPVIGQVFNNRNGQSMSLVDLIKPYQVFYNVCYNQAYELSQREIGKFILMDMNILPNLKDWGGGENFEKFLAVAKALGIGVVDTKPGANGQTAFASSNSYNVLDASESDRIAAKINLAIVIEQQAYKQIGITDARLGQIQASTTATGVEQSVNNSYAQTESYFEKFNNYKRRVLQANVEIAQYVFAREKDITLMYTMSDLSRGYVQITDPDLLLRDLGVYPTFSQELTRQIESMRQLAIQNNTANIPLSGLVQMLSLNTPKEIFNAIKQAEEEQAKQMQAAEQAKMQQTQAVIEAEAAEKEKDRQFEATQNQLDRQNKLQIEELKGIANEGSFSKDTDTTGLLIEQTKLGLQESKNFADYAFKQQQLTNQILDSFGKKQEEKKKREFEEKMLKEEARTKSEEKKKELANIKEQSRNQELMQKRKIEADEKLAKLKSQLEKEKKDKELEILDKKLEIIDAEVEAKRKMLVEEVKQVKTKTNVDNKIGNVKANVQEQLGSIKISEEKEISKERIKQKKLKLKLTPKNKK